MHFAVKNTTFCGPLDLLCPHTCRGCGALGRPLCECCKKYISNARTNICPKCHEMIADGQKKCLGCKKMPFEASFVFGRREGLLAKIVKDYKYQAVRDLAGVLAEFYAEMIPEDFSQEREVIVVPLPTINGHIRERGFDHMLRVAKKLAKMRGFRYEKVLSRVNKTVQVGADSATRKKQAKEAYEVVLEVSPEKTYLLIDDVWTTGASMLSACEKMRAAGAKHLAVAVLETSKD